MQKVLVAEISGEMTIVNAFGNLDTENPLLLGRGIASTTLVQGDVGIGLKLAISDLEKEIGPVSSFSKIPFFALSSGETLLAVRKAGGLGLLNPRILSIHEAIMLASQLIYEEVGDVLVFDIDASTNVYSITSSGDKPQKDQKTKPLVKETVGEDLGVCSNHSDLVKLIGEKRIIDHHGQDWAKLLKSRPETPEELALSAELAAAAISFALQRHSGGYYSCNNMNDKVRGSGGPDLTRIRWIVGTGQVLTQLPNGYEVIKESIKGLAEVLSPQEDIAMLLDKECIMSSLGVLTTDFRRGAWQLLRESFGLEN